YRIGCRALERAAVMPFSDPPRRRSRFQGELIHRRCCIQEAEGKLRRIGPALARCISEVVLVDKRKPEDRQGPTKRVEDMSDDEVRKSWRVTADNRRLNSLKLCRISESGEQLVWAADAEVGDNAKRAHVISQHQRTALSILQGWPANCREYWACVDISEGFTQIELPKDLQSIFCIRSYDEQGNECIWASTRLSMGWKMSPLFFQKAISTLVSEARARVPNEPIYISHFQDDIIVGAATVELLKKGLKVLEDVCRERMLPINADKCEQGDTVRFCGLRVRGCRVQPEGKHALTKELVRDAVEQFDKLPVGQRASWIRSWAGRFEWVRRFLPPYLQATLARLHRADPEGLEAAELLRELGEEYFQAAGPLFVMSGGGQMKIMASIVAADANKAGWGGALYYLISVPKHEADSFPDLPEMENLINAAVESDLPLNPRTDEGYRLVPVCYDGGAFSKQDQDRSSTFRERKAQLLAVSRFMPMLTAPCIVASDNKNCKAHWHTVDDHVEREGDYRMWLAFQRTVASTIWVPRETMRLVDAIARICEDDLVDDMPDGFHVEASSDSVKCLLTEAGTGDQRADGTDHLSVTTEANLDLKDAWMHHVGMSDAEILRKQEECEECGSVKKKLAERRTIRGGPFVVDASGILVKRACYDAAGYPLDRLFVPMSLREEVARNAHEANGLHLSGKELARTMGAWAYWPKMKKLTTAIARSCPTCQLVERDGRERPPPGTRLPPKFPEAWQAVGVDVLYLGDAGEKALSCVCYYSSFLELIPLESEDAESVVEAMAYCFARHGYPDHVSSDNASYFAGQRVQDWAARCGITWSFSNPNHPQCGGWWERKHRDACRALRKILAASSGRWYDRVVLASALWVVNNTEIGSSG
ncbi:hypothetical protein FOZ63_033765, partial [Perkinsus olseni]